jgi:hypothetical protein
MKKVIIIIPIIVALLIVVGFILYPYIIAKDIEKTMKVNFDSIDKITIFSDNTGKQSDIVGKENVKEFLNILKGAKLKKSFDQRKYTGFIYSVTLYKSDKALGNFNFGYDRVNVSEGNKSVRYASSKNIDETQIKEIAQKYNLNS